MTLLSTSRKLRPVPYDWISFTTDYGLDDPFVPSCVGVIATISPSTRIVHITHTVAPQDIRRGATVLAQTVPYLPQSVHLAVVDPGVGTPRRPIVITTPAGLLVGPDNGLLLPAAETLGGIQSAHELTNPRYRLPTVSATFHGRDLFAPAAAHLTLGVPPETLGPELDPTTLIRLPTPKTVAEQGKLTTEILTVDRFGNLQLAARGPDLPVPVGSHLHIQLGDHRVTATVTRTFADVPSGALALFVDSANHLALAINTGSAADAFDSSPGSSVILVS